MSFASKLTRPFGEWFSTTSYRRMGLRADDLIPEENQIVLAALNRLPKQEQYDRVWRIKRATQASIQQSELEPEEWTKPHEDIPYLRNIVAQVEKELIERDTYDNLEAVPDRYVKRNKA
ncbi:14 kDa subunit of cytochrome bd ubiquinol oxidase [Gonapodya prolifera JEL478]|uniref:Cytochrome b-c1 complex subunit 7 n=1 Tax=Gonapodya prolifera (strain JEL478) TaxID=1344416 RepID=A0A139ALF2_GONPJ|nr:14 kDa subunit of cytochrome bd ubiquinol oxidase [Gonapodya prolifera JEL478]|eukprot:KXS17323.1 14 kDa subunit of cytochrome bd ubiquinol oxidase [Gonapodya prolifera JEL478]